MSVESPRTPGDLFDVYTRDSDVAVEMTTKIVRHRPRIRIPDPAAVNYQLRSVFYGGSDDFGADLARFRGVRYGAEVESTGVLLGAVVLHGHGAVTMPGREFGLVRHDGFMYPMDTGYRSEFHDAAFAVIRFPWDFVAAFAEESTGLPATDLRFESLIPISKAMNEYWYQTVVTLVRQLIEATISAQDNLLIVEQMFRLGAAAMLAAFANTSMTAGHVRGIGTVAPAGVRRAVAFIEANAAEPMSVGRIAVAAGVGPRALQEAFRRHLDMTPMEYLRRVRLQRAHIELLAADPEGGATVAGIARCWGFKNLSRFAAEYHFIFGQPPSSTLRT